MLAWQMLRLNWFNNAWIVALAALPVMALVMDVTAPPNNNISVARVTSQLAPVAMR